MDPGFCPGSIVHHSSDRSFWKRHILAVVMVTVVMMVMVIAPVMALDHNDRLAMIAVVMVVMVTDLHLNLRNLHLAIGFRRPRSIVRDQRRDSVRNGRQKIGIG